MRKFVMKPVGIAGIGLPYDRNRVRIVQAGIVGSGNGSDKTVRRYTGTVVSHAYITR